MYGLDLETFLLYGTGLTQEEYEAEMQASAEEAVKQILVLQAIAEKEGMTVTEEDIEADLEENAANYGYESAETEETETAETEAAETETAGTEAAETEGTAETAETSSEEAAEETAESAEAETQTE